MQITLVQAEIETAIRNYVKGKITVRPGVKISIKLSATRGEEGMKAAIDIVDVDEDDGNDDSGSQGIEHMPAAAHSPAPVAQLMNAPTRAPAPPVAEATSAAPVARPAGSPLFNRKPAAAPVAAPTAPLPNSPATLATIPEMPSSEEVEEAEQEDVQRSARPSDEKVEATDPPFDGGSSVETSSEEVVEAEPVKPVVAAPAPKAASLFKGLRKPVNTPPAS